MVLNICLCLAGFLLLYYGADWLVKGAGSLAARLGISPLVIGLSIVAIGTSVPEMLVSVLAAMQGQSMMAVGNVVGSNICNMALGLGLSACFFKITAERSVIRRDMPIMLLCCLVALVFIGGSVISRRQGIVLLLLLFAYLAFYYRLTRSKKIDTAALKDTLAVKARVWQLLLIVAGMIALAVGAKLVVAAASELALTLGASERFVGLTIVAVGTSLPELITSIVAAGRKESAISLGNIIGSNVFNLFGALGLSALFAPVVVPEGFFASGGVWVDYLVMLAVCGLPCVIMWKTSAIWRKGGLALVLTYAVYVGWLLQTQLG